MKAIAAVDENWAIGQDGNLLFHIPEDMRRFRAFTAGHIVIMGRKTLLSLPGEKPLKDRENIVFTRDAACAIPGAATCASLPALKALLCAEQYANKEAYVIGGAQIYALLLPYCSEAVITHVQKSAQADCYFPALTLYPNWKLHNISESHTHEDIRFFYALYRNEEVLALP